MNNLYTEIRENEITMAFKIALEKQRGRSLEQAIIECEDNQIKEWLIELNERRKYYG